MSRTLAEVDYSVDEIKLANFAKALGHPVRIQIMKILLVQLKYLRNITLLKRITNKIQIKKNHAVKTICAGIPIRNTKNGNITPIKNPKLIIHMARSPNTF